MDSYSKAETITTSFTDYRLLCRTSTEDAVCEGPLSMNRHFEGRRKSVDEGGSEKFVRHYISKAFVQQWTSRGQLL